MKNFPDLREFLLLRESDDVYKRSPHRSDPILDREGFSKAQELVYRYDIAKASWEKYGDEGPPIGSKVVTLFAGHGGGPGCIRIFLGDVEGKGTHFYLSRTEKKDDQRSVVTKDIWWMVIQPVEDADWNGWEKDRVKNLWKSLYPND